MLTAICGRAGTRSYTPRLLAADDRTRSADITDYYAGKTSRVELRGDQVGLKSCVRWNPVGTNGLPEGLSPHRVRRPCERAMLRIFILHADASISTVRL